MRGMILQISFAITHIISITRIITETIEVR